MTNFQVQAARADDAVAIATILTDATKHKLERGDGAWGSDPWSEDEVKAEMARKPIYVAKLGDEVVGTVSLTWEDHRVWGNQPPVAGYIHRLAVKQGFHGQNLGKRIIDWALATAAQNKKEFLRLDCASENTNLCKYYEGLGFKLVATKQIPSDDGNYIAALYQKQLPQAIE